MTQPYASAPPVRRTRPSPGASVVLMTALLAGLWLLEAVDQLSGERLDLYGIRAREIDGLGGIATAPFLHAGWDHLISNSLPFWVLGFLVLLGGLARWAISSLISILGSGLAAWALTPADTIIVGASGLIFGWLTYLLARGPVVAIGGPDRGRRRRAGGLRRSDLGCAARVPPACPGRPTSVARSAACWRPGCCTGVRSGGRPPPTVRL